MQLTIAATVVVLYVSIMEVDQVNTGIWICLTEVAISMEVVENIGAKIPLLDLLRREACHVGVFSLWGTRDGTWRVLNLGDD